MALTKEKLQELIDDGEITIGSAGLSFLDIFRVGRIIFTEDSTNPGTYYGGTWVAWGKGRVPVGVDPADSDFNAAGKTIGAKTHTLQIGEIPQHNHSLKTSDAGGTGIAWAAAQNPGQSSITTGDKGGSGAHNNLQPSIAVYMWKRTA